MRLVNHGFLSGFARCSFGIKKMKRARSFCLYMPEIFWSSHDNMNVILRVVGEKNQVLCAVELEVWRQSYSLSHDKSSENELGFII